MANAIIPIDVLEKFENENDISAAPAYDLLYVCCPNRREDNTISSYSAYPMTVKEMQQLYPDPPNDESDEGFCTFEQYNAVYNKFVELSTYYRTVIEPIILSAFPRPEDLTANYMCRVQRTEEDKDAGIMEDFPYSVKWDDDDHNKRHKAKTCEAYDDIYKTNRRALLYHKWADFQTHVTHLSVLARLAHNKNGNQDIPLSNPDTVATDKYLEWRRQFIISLLLNRKRALMTASEAKKNVYARAVQVSRKIRFMEETEEPSKLIDLVNLDLGNEEPIKTS